MSPIELLDREILVRSPYQIGALLYLDLSQVATH